MDKNNVWTKYWSSGAVASFFDERATLQMYQFKKFWFERLDELKEIKSPVVDVGTGNGILVQWLSEYAKERDVKLTLSGIDSAGVNLNNTKLDLLSNTPYETFALSGNKKVGTVVSQFGMEYGDIESGLSNLYGQLKKNGQLVALMHTPESVIVQRNNILYDLLPSIIKQMKKSVQPLQKSLLQDGKDKLSKTALEGQRNLNNFVRRYQQSGALRALNFVEVSKKILDLAASNRKQASEKLFDDYLASLNDQRGRLRQVQQAAEKIDTVQLTNTLKDAGFKNIQCETVEFPETGVVGICARANK